MSKMHLLLFAALGFLISAPLVHAQGVVPGGNSDEPVEITADQTLEWHRNDKQFIARKNAVAKQGDISIAAETLTADYREAQGSDMEIYRMTSSGGTVITSQESKAYGQDAIYEIDEGKAVMTGDNLRMISKDQTVTAQDSFVYWVEEGRINALGRAKIVRPKLSGGTDTLEADKISALMKEDAKGDRILDSLEAFGNVIITTPAEVVTGGYGIYRANTNKAELTGNVTIKRGPNILEGEKAEVDLNTNTSRMFGNTKTGERVRGVFYPGSEKK